MVRGAWCKKLKYGSKIDLSGPLLSEDSGQQDGGAHLRFSNAKGQLVQHVPQSDADPEIRGWATRWAPYCTGELKQRPQFEHKFSESAERQGADTNTVVHYVGIAIDEPKRLARLDGVTKISPLAAVGWTEADCFKICEEHGLLSPIYKESSRGGCWFCHNQSIEQLRKLRKNYPELWQLMLKWDSDSPVCFTSRGITVHDYDRRFELEDAGKVPADKRFRWKMINDRYFADVVHARQVNE